MQRSLVIVITIFYLLVFSEKGVAQLYNFTNYTVESGLSQEQVLSVCQDNEGTMWFGTNGGGITKYNGISYEYIKDKDGLSDNLVYTIVKDKKGSMWAGTNNGISVIDGKNIKNYSVNNGLNHSRVFSVLIDSKGKAIVGTAKGVSILKDSSFIFWHLTPKLDSASVFNITEDSKHNLWFSTLGSGVFCYNGKEVIEYTINSGLSSNYVVSVLERNDGSYWILEVPGLHELRDGKLSLINPANLEKPNLLRYYSYHKTDSVIWMSFSKGLLRIDAKNNVKIFNEHNGLIAGDIWKIYQDRENNLWFGSKDKGISKLSAIDFFMYPEYESVNRIFQSKDGRYWLGAEKGLTVIDNNQVSTFNQNDWNTTYGNVRSIEEDESGALWFGLDRKNGIVKYKDGKFKNFKINENEIKLNEIHDIFISNHQDEIIVATNDGLAQLVNDEIVHLNWLGTFKGIVYNINQDNAENYWLGTENGLYKWDGKKATRFGKNDGFNAKEAFKIIKGKNHELWISTDAGIYKYDNNEFAQISEKDGLAGNQIKSITVDKDGTLWAGFSNGIDKIKNIEKDKYEIRHYGVDDGFMGESCLLNSILIDNQNKIWFGTPKGVMVYQPEYETRNLLEPITHITKVKLYGAETDWKLYADSLDKYDLPIDLKLDYERNYLTFTYAGVSLTTPGKVRYKCMLKGLDKSWLESTSKTEAIYPSLPPGEYEFLVKATNGEGVWNKQPASFKFVIRPPFWQTWWFYSIIAIIIFSGIYSYVKIRAANFKIVKQSHIIEEKNEELRVANLDIAGKNKNITDSINYAQRIQHSFLTSESVLKKCLKDYFILYKPRDIVSGDFYWAFDLPDRVLVACADSTGHGIPGAFMSLIGISLLNEISHSKKMHEPAKILDELRRIIICALNPQQVDEGGKDGMDLALISIFKQPVNNDSYRVIYAGANSAIYIVSTNAQNEKELTEYKADKQPVGYHSIMKPFSEKEIIVKKDDIIYMGTDGYADQFGGPEEKKIMSKRLKTLLQEIANEPLDIQNQKLDTFFTDWVGNGEQIDDVTIFGVKIG